MLAYCWWLIKLPQTKRIATALSLGGEAELPAFGESCRVVAVLGNWPCIRLSLMYLMYLTYSLAHVSCISCTSSYILDMYEYSYSLSLHLHLHLTPYCTSTKHPEESGYVRPALHKSFVYANALRSLPYLFYLLRENSSHAVILTSAGLCSPHPRHSSSARCLLSSSSW